LTLLLVTPRFVESRILGIKLLDELDE